MGIESQRLRDLGAKISAEAFPADAPDNLAHQPSDGDRMIAMLGARLPKRLCSASAEAIVSQL